MELTRRHFLLSTMIGAATTAVHAAESASTPEPELPVGVLSPFDWQANPIPQNGDDTPGMQPVDEAVERAMRDYGIVGCGVCLVRDARIVYAKGYGYADLPDKPFLPDTASRCGSLAKPVTALAALLLADAGKLDLDAPILPLLKRADIEPKPVGDATPDERIAKIKVRHLMDHTSGLPGWATYTAWRANRNVAKLHDLDRPATGADVARDALGNTRLHAAPGERFEYANANFVLLARITEAATGRPFNEVLTRTAMPAFGVKRDEVYVSRNQNRPRSRERGRNEATYYQTSAERYVSFNPSEGSQGRVFGEAYKGYATEASDGAGGIACAAPGLGKILANLHSEKPALSKTAMTELLTPPAHYALAPGFDPESSPFYSKGFWVRFFGRKPLFSHGGMTNHCGGVIGYNAGFQWAVVSNWNHAHGPYVDAILDRALTDAVTRITTG